MEADHAGITWRHITQIVCVALGVVMSIVLGLASYSIARMQRDIDRLENVIGHNVEKIESTVAKHVDKLESLANHNYNESRKMELELRQLQIRVESMQKGSKP